MKERGLEVAHPYRVRSIAEAPDARLERVPPITLQHQHTNQPFGLSRSPQLRCVQHKRCMCGLCGVWHMYVPQSLCKGKARKAASSAQRSLNLNLYTLCPLPTIYP